MTIALKTIVIYWNTKFTKPQFNEHLSKKCCKI